MEPLEYGLYDADNHYYEPRDAFTRHMDPRHRDLAIRPVVDAEGKERILVGDRPFTFLPHRGFDTTIKPGMLREMLRNMDRLDEADLREAIQPQYLHRDARLKVMDEQGLEAIMIYPTFGVCMEHFMKDDVEQTYANLRAFNRWLDEDWGFAYRDRIFAPPLISLLDVDRAVEDLEWALARGTRAIHLRPGPVAGRSPADPHFDRFWALADEARVLVACHISESGYNEMLSVHWGEQANPPSQGQSAFQWTNCYGDRPIMDTISSLIFGNLFGRFENLRLLSVENGSIWVSYLLQAMDKMGGMGRNGPWIGGRIREKPSLIFRRHVYVSPFHSEDIPALVDTIGASQILFGSDFPHQECIVPPAAFAQALDTLPPDQVRRIMRENTRELLEA